MASKVAARYISRRLSSGGKVLSEEEKAAENVYIKKMEKEKLEKLARKGPKGDEAPTTDAKASGGQSSSAPKASTDNSKNYAVAAGIATIAGAFGWYWASRNKQPEQVHD